MCLETPDSEALLGMLAFTKTKAEEGDREAQVIYEQMELTQEVEHRLENYDEEDSPDNAGDDLNNGKDASTSDANEELPRPAEPGLS
eukprot:4975257-Amphidinium_carterae.1